jgi:hypothetical protein
VVDTGTYTPTDIFASGLTFDASTGYYLEKAVSGGTFSADVSGTIASGLNTGVIGIQIYYLNPTTTAWVNSQSASPYYIPLTDSSSHAAYVGIESIVSAVSGVTFDPVLGSAPQDTEDLRNINISFSKSIGTGISGKIAFTGLNLIDSSAQLYNLATGLTMASVGTPSAGTLEQYIMGVDVDSTLSFLSGTGATVSVTSSSIDGLSLSKFQAAAAGVTGGLVSGLTYDDTTDTVSFTVNHFSNYTLSLLSGTAPGEIAAVYDRNLYQDERDLGLTFAAAADESTVSEYRVFVVPDVPGGANDFDLADAQSVSSPGYTAVAKTGAESYTVYMAQGAQIPAPDDIEINTAYRIFVLTVSSLGSSSDHLSDWSDQIQVTTTTGALQLGDTTPDIGTGMDINLTDADLNTDTGTIQNATVTVTSTSDATGVTAILTETTANSGVFVGTVGVSASASSDDDINKTYTIKAAYGNTITVTYADSVKADGLSGNITATATASNAALDAVNGASTSTAMRNALETNATSLGISVSSGSDYYGLTDAHKSGVAVYVLGQTPYATNTAVQSVFNPKVADYVLDEATNPIIPDDEPTTPPTHSGSGRRGYHRRRHHNFHGYNASGDFDRHGDRQDHRLRQRFDGGQPCRQRKTAETAGKKAVVEVKVETTAATKTAEVWHPARFLQQGGG